jgi:hypothetical protein
MNITEVDPSDGRQVRRFLDLPTRLYRDVPQWVPPLASDARHMLDRRRHPFYRHSEAAFFLAQREGQTVGRIAILENRNYNAYNKERTAFFYLFECEDNPEASQALFGAALEWARQRRLERLLGPKGFTAMDAMGLLVRGFEHRPALGVPYNPPYYASLVEAAGLHKSGEQVSGYLDRTVEFPERIHRVAELVRKRRGLTVARYRSRGDLRSLVPKLGKLYNDALAGTTGNVPLTPEEIQAIANQMILFADPHLIKIVLKDDEPVGFLFAYPDVSAALQRTGGRLFPVGWIDILLEFRRTRWININGAGIIEKYRGLGGTAILFSEMCKTVKESRFEFADLVQIGVENDPMQREMKDLGIDFYKMHRTYERAI